VLRTHARLKGLCPLRIPKDKAKPNFGIGINRRFHKAYWGLKPERTSTYVRILRPNITQWNGGLTDAIIPSPLGRVREGLK